MTAIVRTTISGDRGVRASVVLTNLRLVLGDVEAGCVGQVEDVQFILRFDFLRNLEALAEGEVEALLTCLAEDIALTYVESRLINIRRIAARRNRNAIRARRQVSDGNLRRIKSRDVAAARSPERAFVTRERSLPGASDP